MRQTNLLVFLLLYQRQLKFSCNKCSYGQTRATKLFCFYLKVKYKHFQEQAQSESNPRPRNLNEKRPNRHRAFSQKLATQLHNPNPIFSRNYKETDTITNNICPILTCFLLESFENLNPFFIVQGPHERRKKEVRVYEILHFL